MATAQISEIACTLAQEKIVGVHALETRDLNPKWVSFKSALTAGTLSYRALLVNYFYQASYVLPINLKS
jgi:hypothetical protein